MTVLGMFVCVILCRSFCKCTVSNDCDMSSAIAIVLSGVFFLVETFCNCCIYCLQDSYSGVFCFESVLMCVAL